MAGRFFLNTFLSLIDALYLIDVMLCMWSTWTCSAAWILFRQLFLHTDVTINAYLPSLMAMAVFCLFIHERRVLKFLCGIHSCILNIDTF